MLEPEIFSRKWALLLSGNTSAAVTHVFALIPSFPSQLIQDPLTHSSGKCHQYSLPHPIKLACFTKPIFHLVFS